jgi:hypothetical protein
MLGLMSSIYMLVGDHLVFRDFRPYGIIFMNMCVVTTVAVVMLLSGFVPYVLYIYICWLVIICWKGILDLMG